MSNNFRDHRARPGKDMAMTSTSIRRMSMRTTDAPNKQDENALPSTSSCSSMVSTSSPAASITRMRSPSKLPTLSDIAARLNRDRETSTSTGSPAKQQSLAADNDGAARPRLELTGRISGSPKPPAQRCTKSSTLSTSTVSPSKCALGEAVKVDEICVSPKATESGPCSPTKRMLAKGLPSLEEIRDRMSRKGLTVSDESPKLPSDPSSPSKLVAAEEKPLKPSPELKVAFDTIPTQPERKSPSPLPSIARKPSLKVTTTPKLQHPLPAPPVQPSYPLQHEWTLFFDSRSSSSATPLTSSFPAQTPTSPLPPTTPTASSYEANLRTIGSFSHVPTFLSCFSKLHRPSQLDRHSSYHLFKDGIKPMWEDPSNAKGGKWTITFRARNPALVDRSWLWLVLGLIGEELDSEDECCGAVCSVRPRGDRIAVWCKEAQVDKINGVGRKLVKLLELEAEPGVSVEFSSHEEREAKMEGVTSWNNPMQMVRTPTMTTFNPADTSKLSPSAPVKPNGSPSSPNGKNRSASPNPEAFGRLNGQASAGGVFGRSSPSIGALGQSLGLGIHASPNASPNPNEGAKKAGKGEMAFSWRSANRSASPQRQDVARSRSTSPFKA